MKPETRESANAAALASMSINTNPELEKIVATAIADAGIEEKDQSHWRQIFFSERQRLFAVAASK